MGSRGFASQAARTRFSSGERTRFENIICIFNSINFTEENNLLEICIFVFFINYFLSYYQISQTPNIRHSLIDYNEYLLFTIWCINILSSVIK